jgi:hypothetical protein
MLKFFFAAVVLSLPILAQASPAADCLEKVAKAEADLAQSQPIMDCTLKISDAVQALQGLCEWKTLNFKPHFQAYLKYSADQKAAFAIFINATDPAAKMKAELELDRIKRDWPLFGFQGEISELLNSLSSVENSCASNQPSAL